MPANPRGLGEDGIWTSAHEAMALCFDAEGLKWVQAYMGGTTPNMTRDAWIYMYNGDMGEDNTQPGVLAEENATVWIESGPHVMIMPKDPASLAMFPTDPFKGEPYLMFAGTPYAHVMVPLPGYYDYTPGFEVPPMNLEGLSHDSNEWKIQAYSSACPPTLGQGATVLDADMSVLRNGTNGWSVIPGNPRGPSGPDGLWVSPHDAMPLCFDSASDPMDRDAIIYMLHGDLGEDNTMPFVMTEEEAGDNWIVSGPHVMLMPKDPASLSLFTTDFTLGEPYAMFAGTPHAHLMVPLNDYYMHTMEEDMKDEEDSPEDTMKDDEDPPAEDSVTDPPEEDSATTPFSFAWHSIMALFLLPIFW